MKIKLRVAYERTEKGKVRKYKSGSSVDVDKAEGQRLINAGYAVPAPEKPAKTGEAQK